MALGKLLGVLVAIAVLGKVDGACDAACQQDCSMKLQQCQPQPEAGSSPSGGGFSDLCADTSKLDVCGGFKRIVQCANNLPAACSEVPGFQMTVDALKVQESSMCSPNVTCYYDLIKCQCGILPQSSSGSFLSGFCPGYSNFVSCMKSLPSACTQDATAEQQYDFYDRIYNAFYYLYCPQAGGCESAMNCLNQIGNSLNLGGEGEEEGTSALSNMPNPSMPDASLPNICNGKLGVFDCLKTATSTCNLDQGDTTMDEVKSAFNDMCSEVLPQSQAVVGCSQMDTCLRTFTGIPSTSGLSSGGMPSAEMIQAVSHYMASTTRTGFWCSWLQHNYQCAIDNAQSCDLAASVVSLGQQKLDALKTTCQGAATAPPPKDNYAGGATAIHATAFLLPSAVILLTLIL